MKGHPQAKVRIRERAAAPEAMKIPLSRLAEKERPRGTGAESQPSVDVTLGCLTKGFAALSIIPPPNFVSA